MAFVIHPLTQQSGEPKYTAADFRLTVSNFLTAGTVEAFGAVQGVRSDTLATLTSMSGSTITIRPHSGIIAPWTGVGAYAYAITSDIAVQRPTTGDYYVVLVVEDPSQSHGSEPQGRVDLIPSSTPRESVDGLVIARTQGSAINDIATRLRNGTVIETVSKSELDLIKPAPRSKGFVRGGDGIGEYEFNGSIWVPVPQTTIRSIAWKPPYSNGGTITIARVGNVVSAWGNLSFKSSGELNYVDASEKIPVGYRPMTYHAPIKATQVGFTILVQPDGSCQLLGTVSGYNGMLGTWITTDPMPA